ncbi:hypothetical protein SK3146_04551 [Paenibacillus konkukensis]|uniref:Uncharacterized protein n=1 Tax=Paenibacillus konkukensis TaxID=2020716 RepID=A0ABY4RTF7_9BACL|nr:hypothetical protein SK3146_04551 [Paenibacillus konkukensis]
MMDIIKLKVSWQLALALLGGAFFVSRICSSGHDNCHMKRMTFMNTAGLAATLQ